VGQGAARSTHAGDWPTVGRTASNIF
jgi:hypothetical protein